MPYDKQAAVKALREKHAKQLAEADAKLEKEAWILDALPAVPLTPSIHVYRLYGREAGVHYKRPHYPSIDKEPAPTPDDIATLLNAVPPFPSFLVRDGCVGVQPLFGGQVRTSARVTEICPLHFRVDGWEGATLEWYGVLNGRLIEINVEMGFEVARKMGHRVETLGGYHYENRDTWINEAITVLGAQKINYAAGSQTDIGTALVYFPVTVAPEPVLYALSVICKKAA